MIELNDEILNKYIDGELDQSTLAEVKEALKYSEQGRIKLNMLQKVHSGLSRLETLELPDEFTSRVMLKLPRKAVYVKKDKFFITSMFSVFFVIIAGIIGYIAVISLGSAGANTTDAQNLTGYMTYFSNAAGVLKDHMTPRNISIIGSILSFGIIITGYLFFENQRQSKRNLSKLH